MKRVLVVNTGMTPEDMQYCKSEYLPKLLSLPISLITVIERLGEYETRLVFHNDVLNKDVLEYQADCVIVCGRSSDWRYGYDNVNKEFLNLEVFLRNTNIPTLCICAGHQICGTAHGARILNLGGGREIYSELGFKKVQILKNDPLFCGIDNDSSFMMLHRDELTNTPEEFELLASSEMCKVQAMKHKEKALYGVQFHPELFNEQNDAGRKLLQNFLNMIN